MARPVYIYTLVDPRDNKRRWVGQTTNLLKRVTSHLTSASSTSKRVESIKDYNSQKSQWIRELFYDDQRLPYVTLLEVCTRENATERERYHITDSLRFGSPLLNVLLRRTKDDKPRVRRLKSGRWVYREKFEPLDLSPQDIRAENLAKRRRREKRRASLPTCITWEETQT